MNKILLIPKFCDSKYFQSVIVANLPVKSCQLKRTLTVIEVKISVNRMKIQKQFKQATHVSDGVWHLYNI